MKLGIELSRKEVRDIIDLINNPNEISDIFNIKSNIKTYANIEKLDGYAMVYLGEELNKMIFELVNELTIMERENDRKEMLCKMIKDINKVKNSNLAFLNIVAVFHRLNKKMNKYLLN